MEERPTLSLARAALWALAVFWTLRLGIAWLVALSPQAMYDIISLGAVELLVLGAACYLMAIVYRPRIATENSKGVFYALLGLRRTHWFWLALGAGLGLALKFPAGALRGAVELRWPTPPDELTAQTLLLRHDTVAQVLALVLVIGLIGPIIEEFFYRGVLFQLLEESRGCVIAGSFVTAVFAFAHASERDWPALLAVSAALTYVRVHSGTIWASMVAHVAFNCATLLTLVLGWESVGEDVRLGPGLILLGLVATASLLYLARRASLTSGDNHE